MFPKKLAALGNSVSSTAVMMYVFNISYLEAECLNSGTGDRYIASVWSGS